jgi:hypothetical protein
MKMKICLLILVLLSSTSAIAQKPIAILECSYNSFKITGNDTAMLNSKIVRISKDKIVNWDNRDGKIVLSSISDFLKGEVSFFLISNGERHNFRLDKDRKKAELTYCNETINTFVANAIINLPEDVSKNPFNNEQMNVLQKFYVDTSVKIVHFVKGGCNGLFDNGFGFLPIKSITKIISDFDDRGYTIITQLFSKKEIVLTEEEWAKMLNNN